MRTWSNILREKFDLYRTLKNKEDFYLYYYRYDSEIWRLSRQMISNNYMNLGDLKEVNEREEGGLIALESSRTKSNAIIILALYLAEHPELSKNVKEDNFYQ